MDPYEVLRLNPDASFDDVIVAHRRLTMSNNAIANRFAGQDPMVQQRKLDRARTLLEPMISSLAFATSEEVIVALEQLLESSVGPQSDRSEHDYYGEGCS